LDDYSQTGKQLHRADHVKRRVHAIQNQSKEEVDRDSKIKFILASSSFLDSTTVGPIEGNLVLREDRTNLWSEKGQLRTLQLLIRSIALVKRTSKRVEEVLRAEDTVLVGSVTEFLKLKVDIREIRFSLPFLVRMYWFRSPIRKMLDLRSRDKRVFSKCLW
jgi:hypothetical protein